MCAIARAPKLSPMTPSLGSPTLLLVPTELERQRLADLGGFGRGLALVASGGFGPVAAAARSATLLAELRPARVLLVGIAGAYDTELHPPGSAIEFDEVAIDGIGAGEGRALLGPSALGFPQWPEVPPARAIRERLELAGGAPGALLLTTCAAAASATEVAHRRERFPGALAEDMEGFAVACACAMAGVPLRIVRGISNRAGQRDPRAWRIPAALAAARELALAILNESHWPERGSPSRP